uniref:Topoisomerase 6 subunit A/Spo11 TOPRIM domain-containing protein n=1 Tax=Chrysolophus pictus TaxID=9089 RepID=A0A8C3PZR0_CHRPC
MSFEAHQLTVPCIKWLGLLPSDIKRLNIREDVLIPFTKQDQNKLASLQKRPYIACQPVWKKEVCTNLSPISYFHRANPITCSPVPSYSYKLSV